MPETCNNLSFSTTCEDEQLRLSAENTSSSMPAVIELDLPTGTEILDPDGAVVYVIDGDPRKSKARIPPSS